MDFKRLREKWFGETRKRFSKAVVDKVINPLNMELAEASNWRGYFLHGVWNADPKGGFVLSWWEQKTDLKRYEMRLKIEDVLTFRLALENLMAQLCELT